MVGVAGEAINEVYFLVQHECRSDAMTVCMNDGILFIEQIDIKFVISRNISLYFCSSSFTV